MKIDLSCFLTYSTIMKTTWNMNITKTMKTTFIGRVVFQDMMKGMPEFIKSVTMDSLNLLPASVQATDQGADAIKAVLGNLRTIPSKLAEIRNPFGSGHGKSASFQGLEERHAKLAVGSSITFVDFIWSTYENQKKVGAKVI